VPSTDESPRHRSLAGARALFSGPPLVPWLSRLGPASNALSRTLLPARPAHLAGYSPELTSHTLLIDFCSCQESRSQPRCPKLVPRARRHLPEGRAAALDDGASLASGCQPSFTAQGLRFPEGPCNAPPRRPHAETDLPQPDRPEHLLSLIDDHRCLELSGSGDRLGGSTETVVSSRFFPAPSFPFEVSPHPRVKLRTNRCALAHQAEACLLPLGPSPEVTRESFSRTPHPRCLPLKGQPHARPLDGHRASRVSPRCRGCPRPVLGTTKREEGKCLRQLRSSLCCFRPTPTPFEPTDTWP
jgi:hypothetical protein